MPTTKAITGMPSCVWLAALLAGTDYTSNVNDITNVDTPIEFDFIGSAGPEWPAAEGAAGGEFVEVSASNGVLAQFAKTGITVDGATGTIKEGGSTGGGGHILRFTLLEWGKTLAGLLPDLQGKMVICVMPIGENQTTSENGFYWMAGKLSSAITYNAGGDAVVSIDVEISGTPWDVDSTDEAANNAAILADVVTGTTVFNGITPVGKTVAVTPVPLTAGADITRLKAGLIVVK
jgi:hypothetical protein